jgi:hypothetical protein
MPPHLRPLPLELKDDAAHPRNLWISYSWTKLQIMVSIDADLFIDQRIFILFSSLNSQQPLLNRLWGFLVDVSSLYQHSKYTAKVRA